MMRMVGALFSFFFFLFFLSEVDPVSSENNFFLVS